MRHTDAPVIGELEAAIGVARLDAFLRRSLERAGAPTNLAQLGANKAAVAAALATRPDLPAQLADANRYFA